MNTKKLVLLLAVPILFILSVFILMLDVKHLQLETTTLPQAEGPGRSGRSNIIPGRIKGPHIKPKYPKQHQQTEEEDKFSQFVDKQQEKHKQTEQEEKHKQTEQEDDYDEESAKRAEAVKQAYQHAWRSYKEIVGFGFDELKPISKQGHKWMHMALSLVDSIDTMWLMNLEEEYAEARDWISKDLKFDTDEGISFFETTIRVLGGLVSIYDMTGDEMFLHKADELADLLSPAFNSPTGIAKTTVHLKSGFASNPGWTQGSSVLSEAGTVQMEFCSVGRHTKKPHYCKKALKIYEQLNSIQKPDGLYPVYVNSDNVRFTTSRVTLGALGDSFYEYLLKMWLVTGKKDDSYKKMYNEAAEAVIKHLVKKSSPNGLVYIAEKDHSTIDKMDHLVCFAGAMFALGAYHQVTPNEEQHMKLGEEITKTCHEFYFRQPTGLSPELVHFGGDNDFQVNSGASHYILRPETVESYYVLYWITGDKKYQEWGWEAFQAIEKHCRTPTGYTGVRDVRVENSERDDLQQSFFMAETLKYLYLLFSPRSTLDLNNWVFNTEAHPIRMWAD